MDMWFKIQSKQLNVYFVLKNSLEVSAGGRWQPIKLGIHEYQKYVSSFSIHIIMEAFTVLTV